MDIHACSCSRPQKLLDASHILCVFSSGKLLISIWIQTFYPMTTETETYETYLSIELFKCNSRGIAGYFIWLILQQHWCFPPARVTYWGITGREETFDTLGKKKMCISSTDSPDRTKKAPLLFESFPPLTQLLPSLSIIHELITVSVSAEVNIFWLWALSMSGYPF